MPNRDNAQRRTQNGIPGPNIQENAACRGRANARAALLLLWEYMFFLPLVGRGQSTAKSDTGTRQESISFEVATVKRFHPDKPGANFGQVCPDGSGLRLVSGLELFIELGFGVEGQQVKGLPSWAKTELYEVVAKTAAPSTPAEVNQMIRSLLVDRFKLVSHLESKEQAIYSLKVSTGGLKMKPADADARASYSSGHASLSGIMPTLQIARQLTADLRKTVVDNTGLSGRYRVDLKWLPDMQVDDGTDQTGGSSIFTAIQEQLGLKLEAARGPVQILVVDQIQRPSNN
jgi:uncharacterized protein (TIGR03435 family)